MNPISHRDALTLALSASRLLSGVRENDGGHLLHIGDFAVVDGSFERDLGIKDEEACTEAGQDCRI